MVKGRGIETQPRAGFIGSGTDDGVISIPASELLLGAVTTEIFPILRWDTWIESLSGEISLSLDEHPANKISAFDENERDSPGLQKLDSSKLSGEKNDAPKRGTRF